MVKKFQIRNDQRIEAVYESGHQHYNPLVRFIDGFFKILGFKLFEEKGKFWQKGAENREYSKTPMFFPSDYNAESVHQARQMAYEDARNHKNFYLELIKKGVYPEGTKVKVKRLEHSDGYSIQLYMPDITAPRRSPHGLLRVQDKNLPSSKTVPIEKIIRDTARARGFNGAFHEDIGRPFNYGVDSRGHVHYIDAEVFSGNHGNGIPFKGRKDERELFEAAMKRSRHYTRTKPNSLEQFAFLLGIISLICSVFITWPNLTGGIIGNLRPNPTFMPLILFIAGIVLIYLGMRKAIE